MEPETPKVVVFAPRNSSIERRLSSWIQSIKGAKRSESSLTEELKDSRTSVFAFYGEFSSNGEIDLASPDNAPLLNDKFIYHIGEAPEDINAILHPGVRGYIGYRPYFVFLYKQDSEEPSEVEEPFRRLALMPLEAIVKGKTSEEAIELTQAWCQEALDEFPLHVRAALLHDARSLLAVGDKSWRLGGLNDAEIVVVGSPIAELSKKRIEVISITPLILDWLKEDPARLSQLTPDKFEDLVIDRLQAMRFDTIKIGKTNARDGGIDVMAWPRKSPFPFCLAVQIKHRRTGKPVGPSIIRELRGTLENQPIDVGVVVTNTRFTPSAEWVAKRRGRIIKLRGFEALRQWLNNEFTGDLALHDLPETLELAPGMRITIPRILREE